MVHVYRTITQGGPDVPGYARRVPISEIEAEEYNCNIRRYVDNAPPPEPQDVRAHLHGGVPLIEIDALDHFWKNYSGLRERVFVPRDTDTVNADFLPEVIDRRTLGEIVNSDLGVAKAHGAFLDTLEGWWKDNLPFIIALAPSNGQKGNVYSLRRQLLGSIAKVLANQDLLNEHQIRGALANYFEYFKPEFKSIAFSGWGPELIPDDDILQSQFPDLLAEMEQKRLRIAELSALFAAADEEDYEDNDETGILPSSELKILKVQLKEANAQAKLAKREKSDPTEFTTHAKTIEERLARHKKLEDEAKQLKVDLRMTEKKKEELVAAAREKIDRDEARRVILDRLHRLLIKTYENYLRTDQRACLAALENLHAKYAVTAKVIESKRDEAGKRLKDFLMELGYA